MPGSYTTRAVGAARVVTCAPRTAEMSGQALAAVASSTGAGYRGAASIVRATQLGVWENAGGADARSFARVFRAHVGARHFDDAARKQTLTVRPRLYTTMCDNAQTLPGNAAHHLSASLHVLALCPATYSSSWRMPRKRRPFAASLVNSRDGAFNVEWVSSCGDAIKRLATQGGEEIAAVVLDLFLPDSQGIETFSTLVRASPHIPILVLSHLRDEDVARLAVRRGAQDYLLQERLDGYSLSKALNNMLERSSVRRSAVPGKGARTGHAQLDRGCRHQHRRCRQRHLPQCGRRKHDWLVATGGIRPTASGSVADHRRG